MAVTLPRNVAHQREVAVLFGEAVRAARTREGMTQADLAVELGWDRTKVVEVERGQCRVRLDDALWVGRRLGLDDLESICGSLQIPS